MFIYLLLEISQLHLNFFVILHNLEVFANCLCQLLKNAIAVILYKVFTPLHMLFHKVKPNRLTILASIVLPLVLIAFLKTPM
jgi:hypothetical protein